MRVVHSWIVVLLVFTSAAWGATYLVNPDGSGDFPTIQAAIDAAVNGDIIELGAGAFLGAGNCGFDYLGKAITIRSQNALPETCVIDCEGTGPGVFIRNGEDRDTRLESVTITNGSQQGYPGAVLCNYTSPTIIHCIFSENSARFGAVYLNGRYEAPPAPLIEDCVFRDNSSDAFGGAINCTYTIPTFTHCTFAGNSGNYGGAIGSYYSALQISDCLFQDNAAVDEGVGGAIYLHAPYFQSPVIERSRFLSNSALGSQGTGGAIYQSDGQTAIVRFCLFDANEALHGGALYLTRYAITDCTVSNNIAQVGGGIECVDGSEHTLSRCTIAQNQAASGGGIRVDTGVELLLENCIVAFSPRGEGISGGNPGLVLLSCCDVFDNAGGDWVDCIAGQDGVNGNIWADPLFCDLDNRDFTLHSDSPCSEENSACGQMGAWGVGCGTTAVGEAAASLTLRAQSSPNPFNGATCIRFSLPSSIAVSLEIFSLSGQRVRRLLDEQPQDAGEHSVFWRGDDDLGHRQPSGIYLFRLRTPEEQLGGKMTLVQ